MLQCAYIYTLVKARLKGPHNQGPREARAPFFGDKYIFNLEYVTSCKFRSKTGIISNVEGIISNVFLNGTNHGGAVK